MVGASIPRRVDAIHAAAASSAPPRYRFLVGMPLVQAAMYGPLAAFTSEMFGTASRYTGASLGYQLSTTLGGGFAPLVAASLIAGAAAGQGVTRVALFAGAACLVSAVVVALAKETRTRDLTTAN